MFTKKSLMALTALMVLVVISLCTQYTFASMSDEAKTITVNNAVTDNLSSPGTVRYYKVELPTPGKVNLSFNHSNLEDNSAYWKINMFDSNENEVLYFESAGNNATGKSMNAYLNKGTYFVRVTVKYNSYFSNKDYNLTVDYTENKGEFEIENNDSKENATVIQEVNKPITGNLRLSSDTDFYKFTVQNPGKVTIGFNHSNLEDSSAYWKINMFDSDENEVLYSESSGTNTTGKSMNAYLDKGTYYIRLTVKYNSYFSSIDYDLTLNYTENKGEFEVEPNNEKEHATVISEMSKPITGNLRTGSDIDLYKFTMQSSGKVSIGFNHGNLEDASEYWQITVFDSNDKELLQLHSGGTNTKGKSEEIFLNKGTYYVRITLRYSSYFSNSDYQLIINSDQIRVVLNGKPIQFDQPPIIQNGRTLVPLRAIFEAIGASVTWNDKLRTITAAYKNITIAMKIGNNKFTKNGTDITLDVPPQILNGRTLVPARAVAESFGAKVDWDSDTRIITITQ